VTSRRRLLLRNLLLWKLLSALLLSLFLTGPARAENYLDGLWTGAYDYGNELSPNAVWFAIVFETQGDDVKGRMIEVQTFGREPSVGLGAELKGVASDSMVSLVKKYDGSGGQTHSVHLRLSLNADLTLSGQWVLNDNTQGTIHLVKMESRLFQAPEDDEDW
jgi:hypothetical protein